MPGTVVIDDTGEAWPLGAPRLRQAVGLAAADIDVVGYAVRHLGFALLRAQGRLARAEICPALIKPATLIGVYYTLLDWKPQRIVLSRLAADGAAHELFDDLAEFAATVERDVAAAGQRRPRMKFALMPRSWQRLRRPRFARFAPAMALWSAARGRMPADLLPFLGHYGLCGRAALLRNPVGSGRLVYEHMGSAYSFIRNACLPLTLIGQDMEMLPDRDYGDFAARSYHACLSDRMPRLETVNAVMRRDDGRTVWSYYDRLLLPWWTADGPRFVLGLSEVRRRALAA